MRGPGPAVAICIQVLPSHSQVSPKKPDVDPSPPWRTLRPRCGSKLIAPRLRGGGPPPATCVQELPSHSQVSCRRLAQLRLSAPPNSTALPRIESKANCGCNRGDGPPVASSVQLTPSHSHVVITAGPATSSMRRRTVSYTA